LSFFFLEETYFHGRGINEFSIKETCDILGYSESKVKVDYHRALKELKKKLDLDAREVIENAN
jgi:RNA polymerase sigma-70 factor, ECF subfamily